MICGRCGESTPVDPCGSCGESALLDGRYRLDAVLGHGPGATTFRATRVEDGGVVVVKELATHRSAPDDKRRALFHREAAVLRQLDHPRIPRYLDDFTTGEGRHRALCLVQEHIAGATLAQESAGGPRRADEVLEVLAELCEVLAYLHERSPPVVHRDLKPTNVIRRPDGRLVLVDFGSVRDVLEDPELGGSTVAGTFGYMAPEQLAGDASPQSDLYGLGAVAVALLTGREPRDLLDHDGALHWETHVGPLQPRFAALLRHLLAADPARRPASARHVGAEVAAIRAGEPLPPVPSVRAPGPPLVLLGGALAALALVVAGTFAAAGRSPAGPPGPLIAHAGPEPAPGVPPTTYNARANAETVIPALPELVRCVDAARPWRANTVRVSLRVRPDGTAHSTSVNMEPPSLVLDRCVWAWLADLTFPPPGDERPEVWFLLDVDPRGTP